MYENLDWQKLGRLANKKMYFVQYGVGVGPKAEVTIDRLEPDDFELLTEAGFSPAQGHTHKTMMLDLPLDDMQTKWPLVKNFLTRIRPFLYNTYKAAAVDSWKDWTPWDVSSPSQKPKPSQTAPSSKGGLTVRSMLQARSMSSRSSIRD